jgi:hypothetical protein
MAADAFLINEDALPLTGAMEDPGSVFGTVGFRGSVDTTIVNGRVVVKDGHLTGMCQEEIARKSAEVIRKYR